MLPAEHPGFKLDLNRFGMRPSQQGQMGRKCGPDWPAAALPACSPALLAHWLPGSVCFEFDPLLSCHTVIRGLQLWPQLLDRTSSLPQLLQSWRCFLRDRLSALSTAQSRRGAPPPRIKGGGRPGASRTRMDLQPRKNMRKPGKLSCSVKVSLMLLRDLCGPPRSSVLVRVRAGVQTAL
ncbi:hypothetical protein FQA47_008669 [Oryzias melastigma]|uniref:Uncharacterized protein n=1 Tax=Oryzias melastigma TaxID=30732 RepID=A0A834F3C4_ORYME|nr:hypothetical protein FQA47_008669 [Oryzias melastigma]